MTYSSYNQFMLVRWTVVLFLAAAPAFSAPGPIAPTAVPHPVAMFLSTLAHDGKAKVTYSAAAAGTHFFFEEAAGVTVYTYDGTDYRRAEFLRGYTLSRALKKYSGR